MLRYNDYRTINLPWLKEIPAHWDVRRNKNIFTEMKEEVGDKASDYTLLSLTLNGIIPRDMDGGGKFPQSFDKYKIVKSGYMAFCLFDVDETPRTVGLSSYDGMLTGAYTIMQVNGINPRYAYYYYLALDNHKLLKPLYTGLRKTINVNTFQSTKMPIPPLDEQDQIVRFLDWKVSTINKLIATKKKQIALLREREAVHISHVVVRGLNDTVTSRDSGVEWIGDVPEHWKTMRCKYLFKERDERSEEGKEQHLSMSQKYGLVPDDQLDERRMLSESYKGGKLCHQDDLVLNRLKAHLGVFALAPQLGVISPDYTVLMPNKSRIVPAYAETVLKSIRCRGELRVRVRGIVEGFWRLYTDDFNTIVLPVPPLDEQSEIMRYIAEYRNGTKVYCDILSQEIAALQELKTRIVFDVVTGQMDVRNIEIPDYVYVDEEPDAVDGSEETEEQEDE